jgi:hypothetical protein
MGLFNGGGITLLLVQALGAAAYAIWTLVTCWIAWSVIGGSRGPQSSPATSSVREGVSVARGGQHGFLLQDMLRLLRFGLRCQRTLLNHQAADPGSEG